MVRRANKVESTKSDKIIDVIFVYYLILVDLQFNSKLRIDKLQNSSNMMMYEYAQTYN